MKSIRHNGRPYGAVTVMVLQSLVVNGALSTNQLRQVMRRFGMSREEMGQKLHTLASSGQIERTPETADRGAYVMWQITQHARDRLIAQEGPRSSWPELPSITASRWGKRRPIRAVPRARRPAPAEAAPPIGAIASVWAYAAQQ